MRVSAIVESIGLKKETIMKKTRRLLIVLAIIGMFAAYVQAESDQSNELQKQMRAVNDKANQLGNEKAVKMLSGQLGIPPDRLISQKQQSNLGYGELFIANSLAASLQNSEPNKDFNALVQEFRSGKGWGEIAKENGLKLGSVISEMKRSGAAMEREYQNQVKNQAKNQVRTTQEQQIGSESRHGTGQSQNGGARTNRQAGRRN
jgi:hypothetical protein